MNQSFRRSFLAVLSYIGLALAPTSESAAQNFAVTAGDFINYTINNQSDPTLTLERGVTYVFQIGNLSIHPFWIKSSLGFGSTGAYNTGVINNGATSGNITFTVPANAPSTLFYQCGNHGSMQGTLNITSPATPPTVRIVNIVVNQKVTITSTGTNGWSVVPEFKCDPAGTNWSPVTSFTNSFNNGTNTTGFDRLDPICGSAAVYIRIRNQAN